MHPIEVLKLYETSSNRPEEEEIQFEDAEINCDGNCNGSDKYGPFYFMKMFLFVEVDKLSDEDRGWEGTEGKDYKLLDFEDDKELLETLKNVDPSKFYFRIYFWPKDAYDELIADIEEGGDGYMDEGTGDWSREIDYNSPTIERLVKMLQEGEENAKNVSMH